jgi:hypothetical protein
MSKKAWTVAEAKSRLSEILRLASAEGPQRIGTRSTYVLVPEALWKETTRASVPLGQWLVDNLPRGAELPDPEGSESPRIPLFLED